MRYFGRVEYKGEAYAGWQKQKNCKSIQSELEIAFSTVTRVPCKIVGAGRTDAGVHARGQGMHIDLPREINIPLLMRSVNAVLPRDIALYNFQKVNQSFHARYSATSRCYKYYMTLRKRPMLDKQTLLISYSVDWELVKKSMQQFLGQHDFTAFCAAGTSTRNMTCSVEYISLACEDDLYIFTIRANRFIYKMVRSIIGTLLAIGRGQIRESIETILNQKNRNLVGETVSPEGLVLDYVFYTEVL